jgi:hypothetical protein
MGRIIVSENVSLDGVVQDPTGEEGFRRGGWFLEMGDKDRVVSSALPVVLGSGERLFGETSDKKPMRLISARTFGEGLAYLSYATSDY